ncbi:MAG: tRNA pseudouridine(55) synthase TruB [Lachnospiraceae bacterium]|nr:tRNA pseudouridine(55) synthase TruB [Lachnospiraceae bacterium]
MNGIINVYKEKGFTSHDVVAKLRGILKQKKIGHTGTLDPDAQGVLPVCIGNATGLCGMLTDENKEYEAVLLFGFETDTQDATGTVTAKAPDACYDGKLKEPEEAEDQEESTGPDDSTAAVKKGVPAVLPGKVEDLTNEQVEVYIKSFIGEITQIPPMYSALKVGGRKLYELAREGIEVERKARPVTIHDIRILSVDLPRVTMRITCSKGTYIRTLCHDIGRKAGCGAVMESLLRTRVGRFKIEEAKRLSEIETMVREGSFDAFLIPPDQMFLKYPAGIVTDEAKKAVQNGNKLAAAMFSTIEDGEEAVREEQYKTEGKLRVYDGEGRFYGIYEWTENGSVAKPVKMFLSQK